MEKNIIITNTVIKRIALIGPEASGKTTLARQLAVHYKTSFIPEYSRGYVSALTVPYTLKDIELISMEQLKQEEAAVLNAHRFIFADTELIVAKVWCMDVFKTCPPWIEEKIKSAKYDLYLLTQPDLKWTADNVRENGHRRLYFYNWYKKILDENKFLYEIISGSGDARFEICVKAIEKYF